jgi:hypothetical protein
MRERSLARPLVGGLRPFRNLARGLPLEGSSQKYDRGRCAADERGDNYGQQPNDRGARSPSGCSAAQHVTRLRQRGALGAASNPSPSSTMTARMRVLNRTAAISCARASAASRERGHRPHGRMHDAPLEARIADLPIQLFERTVYRLIPVRTPLLRTLIRQWRSRSGLRQWAIRNSSARSSSRSASSRGLMRFAALLGVVSVGSKSLGSSRSSRAIVCHASRNGSAQGAVPSRSCGPRLRA